MVVSIKCAPTEPSMSGSGLDHQRQLQSVVGEMHSDATISRMHQRAQEPGRVAGQHPVHEQQRL